jgi:T5orf172 domain
VIRPGNVYIIHNDAMPGLVKVGRTTKTSEERARTLRTTGVPGSFLVLWDEYVSDAPLVERLVHDQLKADRYSREREFFRVAPKTATAALIRTAEPYRIASPTAGQVIEVLDRLREVYGNIFKPDLTSVAIVLTADSVLLRTSAANDVLGERTTVDMDLSFIWDDDERTLVRG